LIRRLWLVGLAGSFDCSLRLAGRRRWSVGVARYAPTQLEWFRVFSLSPFPAHRYRRADLRLLDARSAEGTESIAVLPFVIIVTCGYQGEELQLAMVRESATGFSSWLESAPPGAPAELG
jgi:hypothetical protein